jgi:hypothetical protein
MTSEQKEQHILQLVYGLPILRRIRLALTILQDVKPSEIPLDEPGADPADSPENRGEEELAEKLLSRKQSYLNGEGENLSRQELMDQIYAELAKKG